MVSIAGRYRLATAFFCSAINVTGALSPSQVLHAIHEELYHRADALLAKPGATLAATFEEVNRHLQRLADAKPMQIDALDSGACACVAFLNERDLWVAGVGDCRAMLATQENLSLIHI